MATVDTAGTEPVWSPFCASALWQSQHGCIGTVNMNPMCSPCLVVLVHFPYYKLEKFGERNKPSHMVMFRSTYVLILP